MTGLQPRATFRHIQRYPTGSSECEFRLHPRPSPLGAAPAFAGMWLSSYRHGVGQQEMHDVVSNEGPDTVCRSRDITKSRLSIAWRAMPMLAADTQ